MTGSLKSRLHAGQLQRGIWLSLTDPAATEIATHAGFDWLMVDGEHGANTLRSISDQLRIIAAGPSQACVRVPVAEDWVIKQALDLGPQAILIPMIHDAAAAGRAVAACRYPPRGVRGVGAAVARASGYGRQGDYMTRAEQDLCIMVQAESRAALDNIDAIAATEGVDVVFIGPADLAADLGHPGQMDHPEVTAAIDHMIDRIRAAGKAPGTVVFDTKTARDMARKGVLFLGLGADALVLRMGLEALLHTAPGPVSGSFGKT